MKYYVLNNKRNVIYGGFLSKNISNELGREVNHNIKVYYTKNDKGVFEEHQNTDLNIDLVLAKNFAKGLVTEYPTLDAAKKAVSR